MRRSYRTLLASLVCLFASAVVQADAAPQLEQSLYHRLNAIRKSHGLEALQPAPALQEIARDYSHTMAGQHFFSHTAPSGEDVGDRVRAAGLCFRAVGENLARNFNVSQPGEAAVTGWMHSPGHRRNILDPRFRKTGIGVWRDGARYYFTQIFFRAFPNTLSCSQRSKSSSHRQKTQPER